MPMSSMSNVTIGRGTGVWCSCGPPASHFMSVNWQLIPLAHSETESLVKPRRERVLMNSGNSAKGEQKETGRDWVGVSLWVWSRNREEGESCWKQILDFGEKTNRWIIKWLLEMAANQWWGCADAIGGKAAALERALPLVPIVFQTALLEASRPQNELWLSPFAFVSHFLLTQW